MAVRKTGTFLIWFMLAVALPAFSGLIQNPSFEDPASGGPPTFWTDTSANFGSNRCTVGTCGNGGGTTGPHTGEFWEWLGGITVAETGTVSQSVVIASGGPAALAAYIWYGARSNVITDVFEVKVDSTTLFTLLGTDALDPGYVLRTFDVSAFADNATHNIQFQLVKGDTGDMNVSVDDVSLTDAGSIPEPSTWGFVAAGIAVFAARFRRRKTA